MVLAGLSLKEALSALGIVSTIAMPLITFPIVLISALSAVIMPTLSQNLAQNNRASILRKVEKSFEATGLIAFGANAALLPVIGPLARLLYQQELGQTYIWLLSLCAVLIYFQVVSLSVLNGLGHQRLSMVSVICGETVQLFFTWRLCYIPTFGIIGYIWAMIIICVVVIALNLCFIQKIAHVLRTPTAACFSPPFWERGRAFSPVLLLISIRPWEASRPPPFGPSHSGLTGTVLPVIGLNPLRYIATLIPSRKDREVSL